MTKPRASSEVPKACSLEEVEKEAILVALENNEWVQARAAKELGLTVRQLLQIQGPLRSIARLLRYTGPGSKSSARLMEKIAGMIHLSLLLGKWLTPILLQTLGSLLLASEEAA